MQLNRKMKQLLDIKNILIIIPFVFGLFYDFAVFAVAIIFLLIIFKEFIKNKKIKIYFNYCFISILILVISSLLTCIWAVDKTFALIGFFRMLSILFLLIILMQKNENYKKDLYLLIPKSGTVMVLISIIVKFIPAISEFLYSNNGRLGGFFQYSNTFALFLLIGIIILLYEEFKSKYKFVNIFILLVGIFLTGSRTVFLLTLLVYVIYIFSNKNKNRLKLLIIFATILIISVCISVITNNFNTIGRYLTISINSSTLWGRIIYYKDALLLLKQNVFGYGYMGYSYIYPTVQTANYSVKFVHNDFLQIALDYGIIPMILFMASIIYSIFSKKTNKTNKIILIIMFLHMLIDFDLQFMIMFYLLILMQDLTKQKNFEININQSISILGLNLILVVTYLYCGIAIFANYIDRNDISTSMLSNYTRAKQEELVKETNVNKANKIASQILKNNRYIGQAYNVKAVYELENKNYELVCEYKEKAISLNKYSANEYEDYILMLSKILEDTVKTKNEEETLKYINKAIQVPEMVENINQKTSSLAKKIKDNSKVELNEQTLKYINNIKGVVENE